MKIYKKQNVWDAALDRIRWLFDEFDNVICNVSGGKDSTVVFHLCLQVAREKGRLPLKTLFLDQEAEWQATIDVITETMHHPDVEPIWLQIPIKLFNATSSTDHWLMCWNPDDEENWMRPKDPVSIGENTFGTDRFTDIFKAYLKTKYPNESVVNIAGVRAEESPRRLLGLTAYPTYKGRTWGKKLDEKAGQYDFYPIYDWSYTDVWKAINDNNWTYNKVYDIQYQYGIPVQNMRVSNLHHETAVTALYYMQEAEPDTWVKLTSRLGGIDTAGKLTKDAFTVKELPFMFKDWAEYRDYLLEHLVLDEEWRKGFRKVFARHDKTYGELGRAMYRAHIASILTNDWEHIKLKNFEETAACVAIRKKAEGIEWFV